MISVIGDLSIGTIMNMARLMNRELMMIITMMMIIGASAKSAQVG